MRAAWAVVVAALLAACAPAEPPLTCEQREALGAAALEDVWPQDFEISGSTHGACDDSGDDGHELAAWVDIQGDEARLSISVES